MIMMVSSRNEKLMRSLGAAGTLLVTFSVDAVAADAPNIVWGPGHRLGTHRLD
jgi:hypothetical protein